MFISGPPQQNQKEKPSIVFDSVLGIQLLHFRGLQNTIQFTSFAGDARLARLGGGRAGVRRQQCLLLEQRDCEHLGRQGPPLQRLCLDSVDGVGAGRGSADDRRGGAR